MIAAVAALVVIVGFFATAFLLSWLKRTERIHAEIARKGLHVAMGLTCLTFPWVFPDWRWFAFAFGVVVAGLIAMRVAPRLIGGAGDALHGVSRASAGEFCFALAVAGLYFFARGEPVVYVAPIAVLTVADALAALTGVFYGRARYEAPQGGAKTWEGSVTFFVVAFLAVHIPVLLLTDVSEPASLSIALCLALLATATEGASWRGLDNLFLPLVLALHLDGFLNIGPRAGEPFTAFNANLVIAGLLIGAWLLGRAKAMRTDALMAIVVFGYTLFAAGGWPIAAIGATTVAGFLFARHMRPAFARPAPDAASVAAVAAPATFAAFLASRLSEIDLTAAGALALAASLGLIWGEAMGANSRNPARAAIAGVIWGGAGGLAIAAAASLLAALLGGRPEIWIISLCLGAGALSGLAGADRGSRRAAIERPVMHLALGGLFGLIGAVVSAGAWVAP